MSRREGRDSDSRHHRSKFDREPSPKRSRRDGKPAAERPTNNLNLDTAENTDRDQKRRRLQDALPLEAPLASHPKVETKPVSKEHDNRINGQPGETKRSSDPTEARRSRSFFQHNERGNAGQAGRSSSRRETTVKDRGQLKDSKERASERASKRTSNNDLQSRDEKPHVRGDDNQRGWWKDSKEHAGERAANRTTNNNGQLREEKIHAQGEDNRAWHQGNHSKLEDDSKPPVKKRPSFREKKLPVDAAEGVDKSATEHAKSSHAEHSAVGSERKEEREKPLAGRGEKRLSGERDQKLGESQRVNFPLRDRYDHGVPYRGRERFNGRQGIRQNGGRVEKWKHDLFDEANRSPTPKNEEDQIAKVEALLSS